MADEKHSPERPGQHGPADIEGANNTSLYDSDEDILGQQGVDVALNKKMHLVNNVST